jgi:hypothetical protein
MQKPRQPLPQILKKPGSSLAIYAGFMPVFETGTQIVVLHFYL